MSAYTVIRTWANWDSEKHETVASFATSQQAHERAEQERQAEFMAYDYPCAGFYVRETP